MGHSFTTNFACLQIGTFISAHGCWIYAKRATENDEADTFFNRDFGEELPATSTGSNRNTKSSKFHNVYEWVDNEQNAGFWGYLMQIAYQVCLLTASNYHKYFLSRSYHFTIHQHVSTIKEASSSTTNYILVFILRNLFASLSCQSYGTFYCNFIFSSVHLIKFCE